MHRFTLAMLVTLPSNSHFISHQYSRTELTPLYEVLCFSKLLINLLKCILGHIFKYLIKCITHFYRSFLIDFWEL